MQRALLDHAFEFLYARLRQEPGIGRLELLEVDDILPVGKLKEIAKKNFFDAIGDENNLRFLNPLEISNFYDP